MATAPLFEPFTGAAPDLGGAAPAGYRGRFAPSPTGPLHRGSLVAALASWLDARAHRGQWLVRIEDLDPPREVAGAGREIIATLQALGLESDERVVHQSDRGNAYEAALARLEAAGLVYGCSCTRAQIQRAIEAAGLPAGAYPGTCRAGARGSARAQRLLVPPGVVEFEDRWHGRYAQDVAANVGDFVLRRADGFWAYQLAVVVDDAEQHITDVVRGADLLDNTPRQIVLQRQLGLPTPRYLHVPVVRSAGGEKLSKQTGAAPLDCTRALDELTWAWRHLGFADPGADSVTAFYWHAVEAWRERWVHNGDPLNRRQRAFGTDHG